jgi:hypothetical protein
LTEELRELQQPSFAEEMTYNTNSLRSLLKDGWFKEKETAIETTRLALKEKRRAFVVLAGCTLVLSLIFKSEFFFICFLMFAATYIWLGVSMGKLRIPTPSEEDQKGWQQLPRPDRTHIAKRVAEIQAELEHHRLVVRDEH